jgi:pimeloyl-ACP methyl ester carboxylesterase
MLRERTVEFTAADGMRCNLIHVTAEKPPSRGPVMLVHGTGVSADSFRPPLPKTLVDALLEHGYDVWLENWRASIDLPPNTWTLDQAARYDHPEAVKTICRETGAHTVKVLAQCQGSTSIMMAAIAGLLPQVNVIVCNAVSLHPVVPWPAALKLKLLVPLLSPLTDYLNPQWGRKAPGILPKLIKGLVALTHHECDNAVCKQVSFTYGFGFATLWSHENLSCEVHEWVKGAFAQVPLSFFRQISQCVKAGHLLAAENLPGLPADFTTAPPQTDARFAFFCGKDNRCFLPEGQRRSFAYFDRLRPNYHSLQIVPGYGHMDVFMGKAAYRDVFPLMLAELDREH